MKNPPPLIALATFVMACFIFGQACTPAAHSAETQEGLAKSDLIFDTKLVRLHRYTMLNGDVCYMGESNVYAGYSTSISCKFKEQP